MQLLVYHIGHMSDKNIEMFVWEKQLLNSLVPQYV